MECESMDIMLKAKEDIKRRLEYLKTCTIANGKGVTRLPFSEEARKAAEYLKNEMEQAGLEAYIDMVGNVRGFLPADEPDSQVIMMGSHYDTVKEGGEYDGIAGVVCAIQVADFMKRSGKKRKYALEIVAFNDEEGMMFGSGCLGSKALTGQVDQNYITSLTDENGISIREWMIKWGSDPDKIEELKLNLENVRAFFEIHIEQGPVLDTTKQEIGIVNCIVGLLRCMVTVEGRADHAGTTPMHMRKDAIEIASKTISKLDEFALEEQNGSVATCGFIRAYPNAMNVIASKCEFTMDIRSPKDISIENMKEKAVDLLEYHTGKVGATYKFDTKLRQKPVYMNQRLIDRLKEKCEKHQYQYREMTSGAAHDAMVFADKVDTVMVFVPSKDGRSHCPQEYSSYADLAKATQIVFETICDMMNEE